MSALAEKLKQIEQRQQALKEAPRKVFHPQPRERGPRVRKEGETFVIQVSELERIVTMQGVTADELRAQLKHQLYRAGVTKELEKAGIKPGNKVRCGTLEWDW
jgi:Obg family GTPase CgtA-like protein